MRIVLVCVLALNGLTKLVLLGQVAFGVMFLATALLGVAHLAWFHQRATPQSG